MEYPRCRKTKKGPFEIENRHLFDIKFCLSKGIPFATLIYMQEEKSDGFWICVRVSSKDQNPERQVKILLDLGIEERNIYIEKKSGHNFNRETYDMLVNHIMRPGDRLTVTELKRFGRNYMEIYREWHHITKELKMDIRVADMKILDTSQNKDLLGQVITDVVLALLSYVAEGDWEERHELQRQGIEVAKEAGKYLGRPRIEFPENWEECYRRWKSGVITAREAMKLTGLKKDSFYRLVKKYENPKENLRK